MDKARIEKDIFTGLMMPPFHYACFTRFIGYSEEKYYTVHNSFQVIIALSGTLHFELEGEKRSVKSNPGSLFVLSPGVRHRWHSEDGESCENFMFFCDGFTEDDSELGQIFNVNRQDLIWHFQLKAEAYTFYIDNFRELIQDHNSFNANIMHGLLYSFCGIICHHAKLLGIVEKHSKQHPALTKAVENIHRDYRKRVTLPNLSRDCSLSQSRLSELFNKAFGMSPIQYLTDLKIKKATQLLTYSDMNITQIAEYLGFSSVHYFSRFFKKHSNIKPSAIISKKS